jgi:cysteine synthase A
VVDALQQRLGLGVPGKQSRREGEPLEIVETEGFGGVSERELAEGIGPCLRPERRPTALEGVVACLGLLAARAPHPTTALTMPDVPTTASAAAMAEGVLAGIGNTPIVRLAHLAGPDVAEVWVKLEAANPTGSYKDRMALAMIEGAARAGRLRPGQPVVEYTGGSTGSSLAFVCAVLGHPLHIVTSDAFAEEKRRTMEAFGAHVEIIPSPDGITPELIPRMRARAKEVAIERGAYQTDQFTNTDMIDGYRRLGEEIVEQVSGPLDALCLYVGTAGCFLGVSRALRQRYPEIVRVAVEPAESAVLSGGAPGTHRIEGGGVGFLPELMSRDDFDDVVAVPTADAFAMTRRAARREGLFSGPSTGANVIAALEIARRLGPGRRVVTIQVDSGLKYLGGPVFVDESD